MRKQHLSGVTRHPGSHKAAVQGAGGQAQGRKRMTMCARGSGRHRWPWKSCWARVLTTWKQGGDPGKDTQDDFKPESGLPLKRLDRLKGLKLWIKHILKGHFEACPEGWMRKETDRQEMFYEMTHDLGWEMIRSKQKSQRRADAKERRYFTQSHRIQLTQLHDQVI